jgi:hypothetical protein
MKLSEQSFSLTEKLILQWRRIMKKIIIWHEFGNSSFSLLLVPHISERIFKFTLSYYFISFLALIMSSTLAFILVFAVYFWRSSSDTAELLRRGNKEKIVFLHHNLMTEELEDSIENLEKASKDLDSIIWGKSNKYNKLPLDSVSEKEISAMNENRELKTNMNLYNNTVLKMRQLILDLRDLKLGFQNSMDYLETRESIFESMPRGRPLGPGIGLITSTFGQREDPFYVGVGEFHNGIDFASAKGTPIYATAPGIILDASGSDGGLGLHIVIEHENGFKTVYGHCSELMVQKGDIVKRGDIIGLVGSTGKATGSHLHYELRVGLDPASNPQEFINID